MRNNHKHNRLISIMLTLIITLGLVGFNSNIDSFNASATGGGENTSGTVSNDDITISKTSIVNNWDNRTYDVTLTAAAKEKTVTVEPKPADIIMVLDRSRSMDETIYKYTPIATPLNTDTRYHVLINGAYKEVRYWRPQGKTTGWYYDNGGTSVTYTPGGTGVNGQYEFYTRTQISKLNSLKEAANSFVNIVKTQSPDSRIGVVSFSNDAKIETSLNGRSLLRVGNDSSFSHITQKINNLTVDMYTRSDLGLTKAKDLYDDPIKHEPVNYNGSRDKIVIFFTDGVPTNNSTTFNNTVANTAIQVATALKGLPYKSTIYSIGIFQNLSGTDLTRVENYMRSVASDKAGGDKQYYKVESSDELSRIFDSITEDIGGKLEDVLIKDYIDPRFRVLDNNGNPITSISPVNLNNGGAVRYDSDRNLWYVEWALSTLTKEGVTRNIKVKALDQFVGGNDITTNEDGSGVFYGEKNLLYPKPTVNVKPMITVNSKEVTIFLGENVPTAGLPESMHNNDSLDPFVGKPATGSFSMEWFDGSLSLGSDLTQLGNQAPEEDHEYILKVTFNPNPVQFSKSTENTSGNVAAVATAPGIYKIKVLSGKITVNKVVLDKDGNEIAIPRGDIFAVKVGGPLETYLDLLKDESSKVLSKLKAGRYTLSEILPKEYQLVSIRINGNEVDINNASVDINKNNPEAVVVITNKQDAKPFFHGKDRVVNKIKMN